MKKSKILIVEDNYIARKVAGLVLKSFNCEIEFANSGKEAILLVQENHYDLLFMDIGLPDIDGFMVTKEITTRLKDNLKLPIIALTAHGDDAFKKECSEVGMVDYIVKPLTKENCRVIFDTYLNNKETLAR